MKLTRQRIQVKGRVQGVFFRASTQQKALELGLRGWVRNRSDGSVEVECEGTEKQTHALVNWCKVGPSDARVDEVSQLDPGVDPLPTHFEIRYS